MNFVYAVYGAFVAVASGDILSNDFYHSLLEPFFI
jgi:hypothetical protein